MGACSPARSASLLVAGLELVRFSIDGFSREVAEQMRPIDHDTVVRNALEFIRLARQAAPACAVEVRIIDCELTRPEIPDFLAFWRDQGAEAKAVPLYNWPWSGQQSCVPAPCPKVLREMFFVVDGRAVLCCWDSRERAVIGDVRGSSVEEIWRGEANRRYRALLAEGRRGEIELCSRCDGFSHLLKQEAGRE